MRAVLSALFTMSPTAPPGAPTRLRTREIHSGEPGAETLIFVHGWPDDGRVWSPVTAQRGLERYRCVVVDLPRCDGEPWAGEHLGFGRLASLLAGTIEAEAAAGATLIAHDWGCVIAALVLAARPSLVNRLALLDIGCQPTLKFALGTLALLPRVLCIVAYQTLNALVYAIGCLGLGWVAACIQAVSLPIFCSLGGAGFRDDYGRPTSWRINYFYFNALSLFVSREWRRANAALRRPTVPLLFLHGSGMFHDHAWAEELRSGAAGPRCASRFVVKDHWLQRRRPEATASCLLEWLRG